MDKKIPKIRKEKLEKQEKVPEKDNDISNSSFSNLFGSTLPQRPYKLGILKWLFFFRCTLC